MSCSDSLAAGRSRRVGPHPKRIRVYFMDADATNTDSSYDEDREEQRARRRRVREVIDIDLQAAALHPPSSATSPAEAPSHGRRPWPVQSGVGSTAKEEFLSIVPTSLPSSSLPRLRPLRLPLSSPPMAAPSHSHLLARPQTLALALALPPSRAASAPSCFRRLATRRLRLRPVAALGGADAGEILGRVEAFLYTVADAAVSASSEVAVESGGATTKEAGDWLSGITNSMETVLKVLKDGLSALHVPYSYGFAIILLTVLVKAATFPLTKKQVESALAMRSLQPQVKAIQERYAGDSKRCCSLWHFPAIGCLPTLVTIPVWIGLYRALSNVANEGLLTEGFFWIPSLAGPTTIAARQSGQGISWLFPFTTFSYPVLLVISQYISAQVMQPPQSNDPNQQGAQVVTKFLPLLIGYFSLSVPSGLSLYWLTNNILSTAQQVWLQKLGGAKNPVKEYIDKLSREDFTNITKNESAVKNDSLPKLGKPQPNQELKPSGPQRGERFRKLKEEESRRKALEGQADQSEQPSPDSSALDGKQNSDVSAGDNEDEQEFLENGSIVSNSNGGLDHSRNERTLNGTAEKQIAGSRLQPHRVCFVICLSEFTIWSSELSCCNRSNFYGSSELLNPDSRYRRVLQEDS
ncbi:hypothetical protein PR202_ga14139 [Eleusine coracana subsp. coracana]|uniref:Membrane insertase YidC/Oxa/ALB C-terminal domain-containing protein n=2 Tax=Magnoliopsida TaxID=3398 RepID=A0AAV5CGC8_ELECO|nr:hypothetical protein PR202_ga14139 [Eleusine coracana subsp. coracana]